MQKDKQKTWRERGGRLVRVFAPFIVLLAGILFLNLRIEDAPFFQRVPTRDVANIFEQAPQIIPDTAAPQHDRQTPIATAIANENISPTKIAEANPSPIPIPIPTLLPSEVAKLAGPPQDSRFALSSPLAFYWYPANELPEDQVFALSIFSEAGEELVNMLSEPNLGSGYQIHILPEDLPSSAGEYHWQVSLLQQPGDVILGGSEQRSFSLVEDRK